METWRRSEEKSHVKSDNNKVEAAKTRERKRKRKKGEGEGEARRRKKYTHDRKPSARLGLKTLGQQAAQVSARFPPARTRAWKVVTPS